MSWIVGTLGLTVAIYLSLLLLGDVYLIAAHVWLSRMRLAQERRDLAIARLPRTLPEVCIQIPVHNEEKVIAKTIDAMCMQSWDANRLEIQILDDGSTDETASIVLRTIESRERRHLIVLHKREVRTDFKAGVLQFGMERTGAQYFAMFDADYRPRPDVLPALMKILLGNSRLAFVQARLDYRNRDHSWLTRAQAMELDMVAAFELASRSWSGVPLPFSGTCGVWRREAIEQAGGWKGRSLSEDLDLSFRALSLGWQSCFVVSIAVAGELPTSLAAVEIQRSRWSRGIGQQFRFWPWRLHRRLPWLNSIAFFLLSQFHAFVRPGLVLLGGCAAVAGVLGAPRTPVLVEALCGVLSAIVVLRSIGALLAVKALGRKIDRKALGDLVLMWVFQLILLPTAAFGAVVGPFLRKTRFYRTPKSSN